MKNSLHRGAHGKKKENEPALSYNISKKRLKGAIMMGKASRRFLKRQEQRKQEQAKQVLGGKAAVVRQHFEAGEYAETLNALAELVQAGGHDAESLYMGAYSYFMTGDYIRAASMVQNVLSFDPNHIAARILLARVCILEDRADDGLAIFDFVIEHYEGKLTQQQREDVEDILEYYGRNEGDRLATDFPHVAAFLGIKAEDAPGPEPATAVPEPPEVPVNEPAPQAAAPEPPAPAAPVNEPAPKTATPEPETRATEAPASAPDIEDVTKPEEATEQAAAEALPDTQDKINEILANNLSLLEKVRVLNAFAGASFVADALEDAEAYLRAALEIDGTDAGAIRNLAVLLHAMGAQDKALAVAAKLPETDFLLLDVLRREA